MPRFDGTGPSGQGAMTGGGRGFCAGYAVPGHMPSGSGRGRFGPGRGRGRGFGRGMGRGFGWRWYPAPYAYGGHGPATNMSRQEESQMLREEAHTMQDEINVINQRIKELESTKEE
ncbi:MAG: DUF5320 domain-containing protein [Candidatus Omnitrophica bacterium]|nr:DUF5320 domain-containing protein [Candidatus Omnitrophota bacterium]